MTQPGEYRRAATAYTFYTRHKGIAAVGVLYWLSKRVGRLIGWMLREAWYRPLPALVAAASLLTTAGISPLAGLIAFVTLSVAAMAYRLWKLGRLWGRSPFLWPILSGLPNLSSFCFDLVRLGWRCWRVRRRWPGAAEFLKVVRPATGKPPSLRQWRYHSPAQASAVLNLAGTGRIVDQITGDPMTMLAGEMRLRSVACEPVRARPGLARLTFMWASRLDDVVPLTDLPASQPGWAMFGIDEAERDVGVLLKVSTLLVGESRSGKSSTIWAMVASTLEQQAYGGEPVEFWVIDLALTEFVAIRPYAARYADTQSDAVGLLRDLWAESKIRAKAMGDDYTRVHKPTPEAPRIVLIIDEMLQLVSKKLERKTGQTADGMLFLILTQAAKYGIVVWCGTQAGKIQVVGDNRDFFQQRICHSAGSTHMTDAALGNQASAQGADCHKLLVPQDAGIGWIRNFELTGYRKFRSVWVPDKDVITLGMGRIPDRLLAAHGKPTGADLEPGAVYVMKGALRGRVWKRREWLYVGRTKQPIPKDRWSDHFTGAKAKEWADEVERVDELPCANHTEAKRREVELIRKKRPKYNDITYENDWAE